MKLPEPQARTFATLSAHILTGEIKIPRFQRNFVWSLKKCAELLDSLIKGYPIGTFIFWRTKEQLRHVRGIADLTFEEAPYGDAVDYVLDGQQRLTSLIAAIRGLTIVRDTGKHDNFRRLAIDLTAPETESIVSLVDEPTAAHISVHELLSSDFTHLASFPQTYHARMQDYKTRIEGYQYSVIQVTDVPLSIATEIFTRINTSGKRLTVFEIMVAKTFDPDHGFDLSDKYNELIDRLRPHNYETLGGITVLQVVAMILKKSCTREDILHLDKRHFVEVWDGVVDAIERAVEYFKFTYRIPVSQLVPYKGLLIPFAFFFFHHPDKPTPTQAEYLTDFFWRCSVGWRYSFALESRLAQDIKKIEAILENCRPAYDWRVNTTPEFIMENGPFRAGNAFIKAMLCIYAFAEPKSFADDSVVNVSNYWLKQANSKNYHHFFPRSYLQKKGRFDDNHVLNITIVDDHLNKRRIRARAPSDYMATFAGENDDLDRTMRSHLIADLSEFGVWADDYDTFLAKRAKALSEALRERILSMEGDEGDVVAVDEEEGDDEQMNL